MEGVIIYSILFFLTSIQLSIPNNLLESICYVESNHRNVITVEKNNEKSIGLCQIKLSTAKQFNKFLTEKDLLEPRNNIFYAGMYLKSHYNKYKNWPRAINAYNRGFSESNDGSKYINKVFEDFIKRSKK